MICVCHAMWFWTHIYMCVYTLRLCASVSSSIDEELGAAYTYFIGLLWGFIHMIKWEVHLTVSVQSKNLVMVSYGYYYPLRLASGISFTFIIDQILFC